MNFHSTGCFSAALAAMCLVANSTFAESIVDTQPGDSDAKLSTVRMQDPSIAANVSPYVDPLGARRALTDAGITYGLEYIGDTLSNVSGGKTRGAHYAGLLELHVDADLRKLTGWHGLSFHTDFYQIHGTSITAENIGSLVSVSNIEAFPSTRLHELWLEQTLFHDLASVRFGQLAADSTFLISDGATNFIASTFGWTTLSSDNLPYGGPIYPFATPGVLFSAELQNHVELKLGIYNGDPVGPCSEGLDPGQCNEYGLVFRVKDPPLLLVEGAHSYNQEDRLFGTIKLGGWHHFGAFDDQRFDRNGRLQGVTGAPPSRHRGNYGIYAVIDQALYRPQRQSDAANISVFARVVMSPSDRNQIDVYADAGIVFVGMVPGRPNDVIGLGAAYTGISANASDFDKDSGLSVIRNYEALLELNYLATIAPGLEVQPMVQYIRNPGGSVPEDLTFPANKRIEDALVLGFRTVIIY